MGSYKLKPNMKFIELLFISAFIFSLAEAEDVVCTRRGTKKVLTIENGDSFLFKTQEGDEYEARTTCKVTYKLGISCSTLHFSCSTFDLANLRENCGKGDKIIINSDGQSQSYCQTTRPNQYYSNTGTVRVIFKSDRKTQAAGAQCTVRCEDYQEIEEETSEETFEETVEETGEETGEENGEEIDVSSFCPAGSSYSTTGTPSWTPAETIHTMVLYPGPDPSCTERTAVRGFSPAGKDAIVNRHNERRQMVAAGLETRGNQPKASNMRKITWDEELAAIAQRRADQCWGSGQYDGVYHDKLRRMCDGTSSGQNSYGPRGAYSSPKTMDNLMTYGPRAVDMWYNEVGGSIAGTNFDPAWIQSYERHSGFGHYTAVVWAETDRVGCGMVHYRKVEDGPYYTIINCNYATSGNYNGQPIYLEGEECDCPAGTSCGADANYNKLCA